VASMTSGVCRPGVSVTADSGGPGSATFVECDINQASCRPCIATARPGLGGLDRLCARCRNRFSPTPAEDIPDPLDRSQ